MHFRQFDANSRKLAQGQGGVLRYVPDARAAMLTQKSRKMAEMPKARIEPNGQIGRIPQKNEKNACREIFLLTRCANAAKRRLVPDELKSSEGMRNVGH